MRRFIEGAPGTDLQDAQRALAQEWASFPDPYQDGRSFYSDGVNRAHISLDQSAAALTQLREQYRVAIGQGMSGDEAWQIATAVAPEQRQVATAPSRATDDTTIRSFQENLAQLGITDARGRILTADNDRGVRTNEAIATFQLQYGLDGRQLSNAELLVATQAALNNPVRDLDQTLGGVLTEAVRQRNAQTTDGAPNYLVPCSSTISAPRRNGNASEPADLELPQLPAAELEPGDRGASVLALQRHLRLVGATDAEGKALNPDRDYGDRTKQAVEQFQLWSGREVTGIADKGTLEALQAQSQFVARQQAQGISPGRHLADNLQPTTSNAEVAADPRPVQTGQTERAIVKMPDDHPDRKMFDAIKERLPNASDDLLAHIALEAKKGHVKPEEIQNFAVVNGVAHIQGRFPGQRASVPTDQGAPPLEETLRDSRTYDQQQALLAAQPDQSRGLDDPARGGQSR